MTVCLQGGAEFQVGCEQMDTEVLAVSRTRARVPGADPRVVIAPFAARPGPERALAAANGSRWYRELGAMDVQICVDENNAELLSTADLLVLPGGSPARLLAALRTQAALLKGLLDRGSVISGASAGAMVLCRWTLLPEGNLKIVQGLHLVAIDLVLPHYQGSRAWLAPAQGELAPGSLVLGLPECSGVIVEDGQVRAAGRSRYTEIRI